MDQDTSRSPDLPQPLRAVAGGLRRLPGAEQVERVAGGALDTIGAVSPRGRRIAVYTGAGVLGVAGLVEWPVALTGAAVAWLTRPRPGQGADGAPAVTDGHPRAPGRGLPEHGREAGSEPPAGPGDRLTPARRTGGRTDRTVHHEPAKVGDTATAEGLKQVAEATTHHGPSAAPARARGDRQTR
ncbi:hypothetical protein HTV45_01470 [Streptomyces sp. CHD11]|uniref:hypothetical protein n=1 Tax=Streptomyces sp. CHD11 TaxID=2741325 RepID=UPI001BFCB44E|nr:hypothetical protein [Streptomyces sp. CHD11]MBT3149590.1 hypothetical protein [Streptomyces sp. CHD11]